MTGHDLALVVVSHIHSQILDDLILAFDSEPQVVDVGRAAGFMQKVCPSLSNCLFHRVDHAVGSRNWAMICCRGILWCISPAIIYRPCPTTSTTIELCNIYILFIFDV
jgi:hypothetical protein